MGRLWRLSDEMRKEGRIIKEDYYYRLNDGTFHKKVYCGLLSPYGVEDVPILNAPEKEKVKHLLEHHFGKVPSSIPYLPRKINIYLYGNYLNKIDQNNPVWYEIEIHDDPFSLSLSPQQIYQQTLTNIIKETHAERMEDKDLLYTHPIAFKVYYFYTSIPSKKETITLGINWSVLENNPQKEEKIKETRIKLNNSLLNGIIKAVLKDA